MPSAVKWEGTWTTRGNVLSTELNSLSDGGYSSAGTEVDNSLNLDTFGKCEVTIDYAAVASGEVYLYAIYAPDGTNYPSQGDGTEALGNKLVATIPVVGTASAQTVMSDVFELESAKVKFILRNEGGAALAASGNTVELFTNNLESQ